MKYFVYILSSKKNGTLYVGMTDDLCRRVWEHKTDLMQGFTKKYRVHNLVWYCEYAEVLDAIAREKQLKKWKRAWKIELIESENKNWIDLYNHSCS